MSYPAVNIDSIIESEAQFEDEFDCENFEYDFGHSDSFSVNFIDEIDSWARQSLAPSGFNDY